MELEMVDLTAEAVVDGNIIWSTWTTARDVWDASDSARNLAAFNAIRNVRRQVGTKVPVTLSEPRFYTIDLGPDEDATPDDACVDRDGAEYPEHDYDDIECRRCGAEPDA